MRAVPAEILPPRWGGTKIEEGGICMGGEVTEDYIQQAQPEEIPGEDGDEVTNHDIVITRNGKYMSDEDRGGICNNFTTENNSRM